MMKSNPGGKSIGDTLERLFSRLEKCSDTPSLDSQVLLAHLMNKPRAWILAHSDTTLPGNIHTSLEALANRLEQGEPLPYILGQWEFFGLEFEVTPDVLIPRPETELLVEIALGWLHRRPDCRLAADIGTGSGCIGIALAANLHDLRVTAVDISPAALNIARRNAVRHKVTGQMDFICSDLFPDDASYHLIVANPPYIPSPTLKRLPVFGHEPTLALDGGPDGLTFIRRFISAVPEKLRPGSLLLMEIEASEGSSVLSMAYDSFSEARIHLHRDLAGHDRILEVQI